MIQGAILTMLDRDVKDPLTAGAGLKRDIIGLHKNKKANSWEEGNRLVERYQKMRII